MKDLHKWVLSGSNDNDDALLRPHVHGWLIKMNGMTEVEKAKYLHSVVLELLKRSK